MYICYTFYTITKSTVDLHCVRRMVSRLCRCDVSSDSVDCAAVTTPATRALDPRELCFGYKTETSY